ncbi:type II toxin-antitoxin system VapC family toxin [Sphingomonas montanisoli]|uniref:Type II toxin-antitoxin system VapC family toxin n=1 Tax=Sphingomonas montanisoli TaxID=2606412 RepID=A0A5D9CBG9_9SPHN|nr:type II toxin-antitoxin system VapC family toxin [Sphingomonas montanisoli]TZG29084.1 type II toxin-antitoxin system VapC family toxin [Sphingomonas montanisoli]
MIMFDTNVLIDIFEGDGAWSEWSREQYIEARSQDAATINHVVLAELAASVERREQLEQSLKTLGFNVAAIDSKAALRAGAAFGEYRKRGGDRTTMIADFLIAAHAVALNAALVTRDKRRIASYFPELTLITPETEHG